MMNNYAIAGVQSGLSSVYTCVYQRLTTIVNAQQKQEIKAYYGQKPRASPTVEQLFMDQTAVVFTKGLEQGAPPEQMLKSLFAESTYQRLSPEYVQKITAKLVQRSDKVKQRHQQEDKKVQSYMEAQALFKQYKYIECIDLLTKTVNEVGKKSRIGGDALCWIGMSYMAMGNDQAAYIIFSKVIEEHPMSSIKNQAIKLRTIAAAPDIPLNEDEKIHLPIVGTEERYKSRRSPDLSSLDQQKGKEDKESQSSDLFSIFDMVVNRSFSQADEIDLDKAMYISFGVMLSPLVVLGATIISR